MAQIVSIGAVNASTLDSRHKIFCTHGHSVWVELEPRNALQYGGRADVFVLSETLPLKRRADIVQALRGRYPLTPIVVVLNSGEAPHVVEHATKRVFSFEGPQALLNAVASALAHSAPFD